MSQPFANPDSPAEAPTGLRFGLLDVMILVTAAAIALWSYELTIVFGIGKTPDSNFWKAIFRCNHLVQQTLSITGLLLLLQTIFIRRSRIRHPGRWILYSFGVHSLAITAGSYILNLPEDGSLYDILIQPTNLEQLLDSIERITHAMLFAGVFEFLIYLFAATKVRGRWRVVFLSLTALTSLKFFLAWTFLTSFAAIAQRDPAVTEQFSALSFAGTSLNACVAILVVCCCIADWKRRDWKHWLGVGLLFQSWYAVKTLTFVAGQLAS